MFFSEKWKKWTHPTPSQQAGSRREQSFSSWIISAWSMLGSHSQMGAGMAGLRGIWKSIKPLMCRGSPLFPTQHSSLRLIERGKNEKKKNYFGKGPFSVLSTYDSHMRGQKKSYYTLILLHHKEQNPTRTISQRKLLCWLTVRKQSAAS